jgi:hypothetical protein
MPRADQDLQHGREENKGTAGKKNTDTALVSWRRVRAATQGGVLRSVYVMECVRTRNQRAGGHFQDTRRVGGLCPPLDKHKPVQLWRNRFFFANVVSFENQRRLSGSGTHKAHTTSSSEI